MNFQNLKKGMLIDYNSSHLMKMLGSPPYIIVSTPVNIGYGECYVMLTSKAFARKNKNRSGYGTYLNNSHIIKHMYNKTSIKHKLLDIIIKVQKKKTDNSKSKINSKKK